MEVVWSDLALTQLDEVIDYVEEHFGLPQIRNRPHKMTQGSKR